MSEEEIEVIREALDYYASRRTGWAYEDDRMERRKTAIAKRLWHDLTLMQCGCTTGHGQETRQR